MPSKITVKTIKAISTLARIDDLTVGELYTFVYKTSGATIIGACGLISETNIKCFIPFQISNIAADSGANSDCPFYSWYHTDGHTLSGTFTPFQGSVTIKST